MTLAPHLVKIDAFEVTRTATSVRLSSGVVVYIIDSDVVGRQSDRSEDLTGTIWCISY